MEDFLKTVKSTLSKTCAPVYDFKYMKSTCAEAGWVFFIFFLVCLRFWVFS